MRLKITSKGITQGIGIGINYDLEYKDLVFHIGKWYLAIGIR